MGYNGEKGGVPRVVKDTIQFLRDSGMFFLSLFLQMLELGLYVTGGFFLNVGMTEEGLFRRSPSSVMLRAAQDAYDRG